MKKVDHILDIPVSQLKTDFIRIENRAQFLEDVKSYSANDPNYIPYWREQKEKCVVGIWGEEFGKYRYMPPTLYFYANFFLIEHTNQAKHTSLIKPIISDLEWEIHAMVLAAQGFSGFDKDEFYSSDNLLIELKKNPEKKLNDTQKKRIFNSKGQLKTYVDPLQYIRQLHDSALGKPLFWNEARNVMILGSRGGGKETPLTNKIPTPNGWTTMGDIKVGDFVFGSDGKPCQVLETHFQGTKRVWEVEFADGRVVECGRDHLWIVEKGGKPKLKTLSTKEMYDFGTYYGDKAGKYSYKFKVPTPKPVFYPEQELPIDPYILGCLLGDGSMTTRTPKIASSDPFIIDEFRRLLPEYELKYDPSTTNNYTIVDKVKGYVTSKNFAGTIYWQKSGNRLYQTLKGLKANKKCREKFIPEIYKRASEEQRLHLIQGLIDTDGCVTTNGSVEFGNTNKRLIEEMAEVCRSLGIKCQIGQGDIGGTPSEIKGHKFISKPSWRLYLNTTKQVARLPRKKNRLSNKKSKKNHNFVSIVDIRKTDRKVEQKCISVDSLDNSYLTDNYVVTHNSYTIAGLLLHSLVTDAGKYYSSKNGKFYKNPDYKEEASGKDLPMSVSVVGSSDTNKSGEMLAKVQVGMNALATEPEFGVIGEPGEKDYIVCPLYKEMTGSLKSGNKQNPWAHNFKYLYKGTTTYKGSKSRLFHVSYSDKKKDGAQASAGSRLTGYAVIEEVGLVSNAIEVYNSNNSAVSRDGAISSQIFIGTSGNLELIEQTKRMFYNPQDYKMVSFSDDWEGLGKDGKIGFFLPNYLTYRKFKDEQGNTLYDEVFSYIREVRESAAKADDQSVLREEKLNRPIIPSEMFTSLKGHYLPVEEAIKREKVLMTRNLYDSIGTNITIHYSSESKTKVDYRIDHKAEPFYSFPWSKERLSLDGATRIFAFPQEINGNIPNDMYYFTHDPYVSENLEEGGSLGTTHVWLSPKYWDSHMPPTGPMVATYIGKPLGGLRQYNENLEKLIMFYGSPSQSLAYEANRGATCKSYFESKKKLHLLYPRPENVDSQSMFSKRIANYGLVVGNKIVKIQWLDLAYDFLMQPIIVNGVEVKLIETIPCIFTIRQIMQYDIEGNFDSVSSLIIYPKVVQAMETSLINQKQQDFNILSFLSQNKNVFRNNEDNYNKQKRQASNWVTEGR